MLVQCLEPLAGVVLGEAQLVNDERVHRTDERLPLREHERQTVRQQLAVDEIDVRRPVQPRLHAFRRPQVRHPHPIRVRPPRHLRRPGYAAHPQRRHDERGLELADGRQRVERRERDDRLACAGVA